MIASQFVDLVAAAAPAPPSPPATALELQRALVSWNRRCEEALSALRQGELDALDAALAARDELRPQISELVRRVQLGAAMPPDILATLEHLQRTASTADRRLSELLDAERSRLQAELDGLDRTGTHPYALPEGPRPRLDIRR